ncbi:MAG: TonB family protein [Deltaproteobacteria bacterium]|nr:TonB family protein [Deltaproteobacteria bacterium]
MSAAAITSGAGAWLALHLSKSHPLQRASATKVTILATAPIVELAKQTPVRIQGDVAGTKARDSTSLLKMFDDNKVGLADVYGNVLASDPEMKDGMVVRLHILPSGSVDSGAVRISTAGNPSFDAEIVEAMTSWKFAPTNGSGVTADYLVLFAPSASTARAVESDLNTKLASLSPIEAPEYALSPSGATPAAASEPTMVAGFPHATPIPEAMPTETLPAPSRVRHYRRPPREMAALPPPKPPLIERVNSELRATRKLRRVQAYVNGSVVTIFGKVFDNDDRLLAERTVRNVDGVSAVINNVSTDTQRWEQNQASITQALQNAGLNNIQVKVIGSSAYLSGQVKTDRDRERAVRITQATARVKVRENFVSVVVPGRPPENSSEIKADFPWPPPKASARVVLPGRLFQESNQQLPLRAIDLKLSTALESAGYLERSYFAVPDGFALVTRLEQIDIDGTPKPVTRGGSIASHRFGNFH